MGTTYEFMAILDGAESGVDGIFPSGDEGYKFHGCLWLACLWLGVAGRSEDGFCG